MKNSKNNYLALGPLMLCFFTMGFVDLVGIASNFVKADLGLSDYQANVFPSMVFFWFLFISVPTGVLMNKIGRKRTVLLSIIITAISLFIPILGNNYSVMLISFSLLGIGNAIMQTSLNPLVSNIINDNRLAGTLTFGQFVKAIASFLAPYIAVWGATSGITFAGLGWRILFPIYMTVAVIAIILLSVTSIPREPAEDKKSSIINSLSLLSAPFILFTFLGIICHVGIDVGTNTTAPKILMEKFAMSLEDASFATSLYFIFRTLGCLIGAYLLNKVSNKYFFGVSVLLMVMAMFGMLFFNSLSAIYCSIALIGLGNSNIFPIIYSQAILSMPAKQNEISDLMIMGLFGGTIFPIGMGLASDAIGQAGAIIIMMVGVAYLLFLGVKLKNK